MNGYVGVLVALGALVPPYRLHRTLVPDDGVVRASEQSGLQ
jgi:hypothetical protein